MKYFSYVGSYRGAVRLKGRWVPVTDLNRIDKTDWVRHQGPPTPAMQRALRGQPINACDLFPNRVVYPRPV